MTPTCTIISKSLVPEDGADVTKTTKSSIYYTQLKDMKATPIADEPDIDSTLGIVRDSLGPNAVFISADWDPTTMKLKLWLKQNK